MYLFNLFFLYKKCNKKIDFFYFKFKTYKSLIKLRLY